MRKLLSVFMALCFAAGYALAAPGAVKCQGTVVDEGGEPVIGASVVVTDGVPLGITDTDGHFTVNAPASAKTLTISFIGYKPAVVPVRANMGKITLKPEAEMLADVVVTQSLARTRQTPVALSQVNAVDIDLKLGSQEFPEILKTTPGVWATKDGGGFGDAKINMRGFQSQNVAVMVNGIPVNDMEGGWVYWSNWAGLNDVASNIQTQRGLGAALLSAPSIGGTINVTTRSTDAKRGGSVFYGFGNDGMNNIGMTVSTGLMKNGWAVTLQGSRKWGDGYIQGTFFNSYSYFVNISKKFNDKHQLSLTAFGAPQKHNKRSSQDGLTIMEYQTYAKRVMDGDSPYKYNASFGYDKQGQVRSSNLNTYHKPQISLAHIWQISEKKSLSTTLYASIATGGGYSGQGRGNYSNSSWYGATDGVPNTLFRNEDGTFGYNLIQDLNAASTNGSQLVMSQSNNSHNWFGLVSTYNQRFLDNKLNFTAGIDIRYYVGKHDNKIIDLYDGAYYIDPNRSSVKAENNVLANDPAWVNRKLGVGDVVYRDYSGHTAQEGAYAQAEYQMLDRRLTLVASGSLSNTGYWRYDRFYYDKAHAESPTYNFLGGTVKGGVNYNFDRHNNVFANVGYISRAPFFASGVFLSQATSNAANPDPLNEKIFSAEIGYGYSSRWFSATVNGYYTKWLDKTTTRSGNITSGEHAGDRYYMNMAGVDARHMGVEVNFTCVPAQWVEITGMVSLGDYNWDSNSVGYFYNQNGEPLKDLAGNVASGILAEDHIHATLEQKGRKVGGSAQFTGAFGATFKPFKGMRVGADWTWAAHNYSDYTISASSYTPNGTVTVGDPWCIPWGNQLDLNASYRFDIGGVKATLSGNVHNLFNYNYVVDAYTSSASNGTWDNAYRVFYAFGRTYSMKLRINF